jgi:hypothetical protein
VAILTIQAENSVDRCLGCRSEGAQEGYDWRWTENYCWDSLLLEAQLGVAECRGSQDPEKS